MGKIKQKITNAKLNTKHFRSIGANVLGMVSLRPYSTELINKQKL